MRLIRFIAFLFCTMIPGAFILGQDTTLIKKDTPVTQQTPAKPALNPVVLKKPTAPKPVPDSVTGITVEYQVSKKPDSIGKKEITEMFRIDSAVSVYGVATGGYIVKHPTYHAAAKAVRMVSLLREPPKTDWIFYLFAGLLFYLALLKLLFPKYFSDVFRVFFNTALRQKQIREQLIQEPLPSLLLNILFVFTGAVFAYFLMDYYGMIRKFDNKWLVLGFCVLALIAIYLVKYLFLRFMGWILARREEAETYNFVVFMVNKVSTFVLLPAALLLAVADTGWIKTVVFFSYLLLGALLLYRWIRSFQLVHKGLRINQLQLLIFVVSFEVIPILVLYKVLFKLFG